MLRKKYFYRNDIETQIKKQIKNRTKVSNLTKTSKS